VAGTYQEIFQDRTTPQSIGLTAHRTGACLETKEAFKAERAGSAMALLFLCGVEISAIYPVF